MTKILAALLALVLPLLASAACTYATAAGSSTTVATCTLTTEAAPTLVTEGLSLNGLHNLAVMVESTSTMTAGGTFQVHVWIPAANAGNGAWVRMPDADLIAQALTRQLWPALSVFGSGGSRVDFRPAGTGAATTTIHLMGLGR